jgi:hypothetical protein
MTSLDTRAWLALAVLAAAMGLRLFGVAGIMPRWLKGFNRVIMAVRPAGRFSCG